MPSAFPFPAPHLPDAYHTTAAIASSTPTDTNPSAYIPFVPDAPPVRRRKAMTANNLMNRITNEYIAKILSLKGFDDEGKEAQLSLITEIFCALETKYFDGEFKLPLD